MICTPVLLLVGGAGSSSFSCPSYATVLLKLTNAAYTPPAAGSAGVMQLLPCPYTPPTVI